MDIETLLKLNDVRSHQVVKFTDYLKLDLSKDNQQLKHVELNDEHSFTNFIFDQLRVSGKQVALGGYGEVRSLYSRSGLFEGEEPRTVHLGIDIWTSAGTEVYVPIDSKVHSFANRDVHGDYGPVIILEHLLSGEKFHTLYGHLSVSSLENLHVGKTFKGGDMLATIGNYSENFHWPPHLHFQVIVDMEGHDGDYPGVSKATESQRYLSNCPDPAVFVFCK